MKKNKKIDSEPNLHPGSSGLVRRILNGFGKIYGTLFYSVEAHGLEKLPRDGSIVVLCKHQRIDDIPVGLAKGLYSVRYSIWAIMKDSLAAPHFMGFFLRCGGIPLNRREPRKSKKQLLFARKILNQGNMLVIFPEQTIYPYRMGRGRPGGFRFIVGKPKEPLPVVSMGMEYIPGKFPRRTKLIMRIGDVVDYDRSLDPDRFMHERMLEIAKLSNMEYPYKFQATQEDPTPAGTPS